MNELIDRQQKAATEIIRIAHEAGIAVIVWTAEDANEAINRAADRAGATLTDEEAFDLAVQLLEDTGSIEEPSIEAGWDIINAFADDIIAEAQEEGK
jgi:riboflavin biosynthesis pyrimidine reductase